MLRFSVFLGCALLLASGGIADASTAGPPSLDGWRLTLPVESDGGGAEVLNPAELDPPYLTRADDGSLHFWAPTAGATTSHSGSPRTELIDNTGFASGTGGAHTLAATVTVEQVPKTSKTIILGQIHGDQDRNSDPYTMLYYSGGTVHVKVNQQLSAGSNYLDYPLLTGVGLGAAFSYTITDRGDGTLRFSATRDGSTEEKTAPVPSVWSGEDVRFQAGDYEQLKGDPEDGDGGKVTFSVLTAS
ncbi:polysaccharide lyase family 7 protein [Amycolatopsis sp. NBC_00345]|uniref:polysaccharide lyase family 7 protein n=1 Tax=Amycolatopsis sp. NBC_00345 TaxID=2975955 RepID=UPI002E253461